MGTETAYSIKVTGPGLLLEREVSREIGDQIVLLVLSGEEAALVSRASELKSSRGALYGDTSGARPDTTGARGLNLQISVREFLSTHAAKRNIDKITVFARYLQLHRSQPTFSREDLLTLFIEAAEPAPKNMPRDIKWAVRAGWIAQTHRDKGEFYLTNDGIEVVDNGFPREAMDRTRQLYKTRKR